MFTHFPKDRSCEVSRRTTIPCRKRTRIHIPRAEIFGDLITADQKGLDEKCESRNSQRYAVVVQDLATQWIQVCPCKTKTSQETERSLQKFLEPEAGPKVIYTDNSLDFGEACEHLLRNHFTSTPQRSETNSIAERAVRRKKEHPRYFCRLVPMKSGGPIPWNVTVFCETFKASYRTGNSLRTTFWRRFGWANNSFWIDGISSDFCERPVKTPPVWQKGPTGHLHRIYVVCGENLERRHLGRRR